MDIKNRIEAFNRDNAPFYLVDHDSGEFSLCLALSFVPQEYRNFGQEAFNRYAERNGEPVMENGLYTHGSGYEWEDVFKKAFETDENIGKIGFDCEASGFFCYAEDLSLLEEFGRRFRALCMDTKNFESLVCSALQEAAVRRAEAEELSGTIRGFLMECPGCTADIQTPDGQLQLTAEMGGQLLDGSLASVRIGACEVGAEELLSQQITHIQQDLFEPNHFRMRTKEPETDITPAMEL